MGRKQTLAEVPEWVEKRTLRGDWKRGSIAAMTEYLCWFCGQSIDRTDAGAVMITLESLWRWEAGSHGDDDPLQSVYGHSACAKGRMKGATMDLEPSIFGEKD